jgi:hypothetical protein
MAKTPERTGSSNYQTPVVMAALMKKRGEQRDKSDTVETQKRTFWRVRKAAWRKRLRAH